MANITLKNGAGIPVTYSGIESIEIPQADEQILPETELVGFAYDDYFGLHVLEVYPSPLTLEIGESYTVEWDGATYECACQDLSAVEDGAVGIGALADYGGTGNGEPFVLVTLYGAFLCASSEDIDSHTVEIKKKGGVQTFSAGGGSSDDVRYVTFMNGNAKLYVKPVATGDDCVDVLARGFIDTPTKESTAQTNYAYSGWALTDGGEAISSALASVTENRTVYAAYTESARHYTISYYDEGSLLKTESLPYGTMPSYAPTKEGYTFTGWTPAAAAVTEDAVYSANWIAKYDFASLTWAQISEISRQGNAATVFDLGAKKIFEYKSGGTIKTGIAEIVGFDHDDLADGSGKAGITLRLNGCTDVADSIQSGEWNKSWDTCEARTGTTTPLYNDYTIMGYGMEPDLYRVIRPVTKPFYHWANKAMSSTTDGLFLPSMAELGYNVSSYPEGSKYELFATNNKSLGVTYPELICKNSEGTARSYWTRTKSGNYHFYRVKSNGAAQSYDQAISSENMKVMYTCI